MANHWKTLLISPSRKMITDVTPLLTQHLAGAPVFDVTMYPARNQLQELLNKFKADLCLLDVTTDKERALMAVSDLQSLASQMPVIAMLAGDDPDFIMRCLRTGATEFLIQPFTPEQVGEMLDRVAKVTGIGRKTGPSAKIVCVLPAKGASGATTVAANLAHHCRRLGYKKVLLADMDPLTGTLSFVFKLKSQYSFLDVLSRQGNLDADLWKGTIVTSQGLDFLLSPESLVHGIGSLQDASPIVDYARDAYDVVVMDSGTAYGEWNLSLAQGADEVLVVATNELPSLQAAQRTLTYLEEHQIPRAKTRLVLNRYTPEHGLNKEVIATALDTEVFCTLPSDFESVQKGVLEGKPVAPSSLFGKSLAALANQLIGKKSEPAGAKADSRKSSWFSSIFGG